MHSTASRAGSSRPASAWLAAATSAAGTLIPASLPEFFETPVVADDGGETIG